MELKISRCVNNTLANFTSCRDDSAIDKLIDELSLLTVYNEEAYDPDAYGDDPIIKKTVRAMKTAFDTKVRPYLHTRSIER